MKKLFAITLLVSSLFFWSCNGKKVEAPKPTISENATTQEVKPKEQKAPAKKVLSLNSIGKPIFADIRPTKIGKINYIATSKGLHTEKNFLQLAEDLKNEEIKSVIVRFLEDDTAIQLTTGFMTTAVYGTFDKSTNGIGRTISEINFEKDSIKNMPEGILRN